MATFAKRRQRPSRRVPSWLSEVCDELEPPQQRVSGTVPALTLSAPFPRSSVRMSSSWNCTLPVLLVLLFVFSVSIAQNRLLSARLPQNLKSAIMKQSYTRPFPARICTDCLQNSKIASDITLQQCSSNDEAVVPSCSLRPWSREQHRSCILENSPKIENHPP